MDSLPWLDPVLFSGQARGNQAAIFLCGEDQYSSARPQETPVSENPGYNRRVGRDFNHLFPVLILEHNRPARTAADSADSAVGHGPILRPSHGDGAIRHRAIRVRAHGRWPSPVPRIASGKM